MRSSVALIAAAFATAGVLSVGYLSSTEASGLPTATSTALQAGGLNTGPATAAQAPANPIPVGGRPLLHPAKVTLTGVKFGSWALLNRSTGEIVGSLNLAATNTTASMIKAWLAADVLRQSAEKNQPPPPATLSRLSIMIRDSDNDAASDFYEALGNGATISRLAKTCGLTDTKAGSDWSQVLMSARDAVRMGGCIGDSRAAGARWTPWLLKEMRAVRGAGRFGVISALPAEVAEDTAIKNGWINRPDGTWHINCLAIGTDWSVAVMLVYPVAKGMSLGAATCKSVAQQLMA
jgi:hypothetical protein